ncbi:hypothetical protein Cni_G05825 [Canna indica]|uniref:BZIP domain-containing protein n=1 Tax=Canna indica TaxID=4628 RepID=A0AAQ3Q5R8_9LILI|nr:hypothetical protein Cni_G05825 [Canna indica]
MNWSPSEFYQKKGMPNPDPVHGLDLTSPAPPPSEEVISDRAFEEGGEVLEIDAPVSSYDPQPSEPSAAVDPQEYASILKQKLDLYCAAVALSRSSGADPHNSVSLIETRSLLSDSPHHQSQTPESQTPEKGSGSMEVPSSTMLKSIVEGTIASGSSRVISDDDELDGEAETAENADAAQMKRVRRMLSNRESARRSRKRKQAHVNELEAQVSQLRVENSSLIKRLSSMNQKYSEAAASNKKLKADVETLTARVEIAENTVTRLTGEHPSNPSPINCSTVRTTFTKNPSSDATSDARISDGPTHLSLTSAENNMINTCLLEIASSLPFEHTIQQTATRRKTGPPDSLRRVASLESLQKRICCGASSCTSLQMDDDAVLDPPETSQ